tara:strand:- start:105 stop:527 length:423 start_codon:yes stop_codon:yes gene_type:complete
MTEEQLAKLQNFFIKKQGVTFEWGHNDCNTLVVEMHDYMYGTSDMSKLRGRYWDLRSAVQFVRQQLDHETWLKSVGYTQITDDLTPEPGDVIMGYDRVFWCGHIYYNNRVYSIDQDGPFRQVKLTDFPPLNNATMQLWRK